MLKSKIPTFNPSRKTFSPSETSSISPKLPKTSSSSCKTCSLTKSVVRATQENEVVENPMTLAAIELKEYQNMERLMMISQGPVPGGDLQEIAHNQHNPAELNNQAMDPEEAPYSAQNQQIQSYDSCANATSEVPLNSIPAQARSIPQSKLNVPEKGISRQIKPKRADPKSYIALIPSKGGSLIRSLEGKMWAKIFAHVSHAELQMCRIMDPLWNSVISKSDFYLDSTVFVVNIEKFRSAQTADVVYNDLTSIANLPFRHGRFQYIDHEFLKNPQDFQFQNSDNEKYVPRAKFLQSLWGIEFRNCFLLWKTIKSYLVQAVQVTSLKITNCHISSIVPTTSSQTVNEFQEFNAGNAIFGVKSLEIYEMCLLTTITSILVKFNGYSNQGLVDLKISYHPSEKNEDLSEDEMIADARDFCRALLTLIKSCKNSLQNLFLDIQHDITLDVVGHDLSRELAALGAKLNLIEFQLSPGLECWLRHPELIPKSDVAMNMKSLDVNSTDAENKAKYASASLAWFLESQRNLETLGLPYIDHVDNASFFKTVLRGLPCRAKLKYLAVPSASFLPVDLFHHFPSLKGIKIGEPRGKNSTMEWSIFHEYTKDVPRRLSAQHKEIATLSESELGKDGGKPSESQLSVNPNIIMLRKIKELSISSTLLPNNFSVAMKNMRNLTHLDVNIRTPAMRDGELQLCIRHLDKLTSLAISCADELTDFGLTGLPEKNCQYMFQRQLYYEKGVNSEVWNSKLVTGRPLSDLKSLRKLVLMGMESHKITDIGLGYGVAFDELKYCHLPYSHHITDWGIETVSENNPSLETLSFSGLHQNSIEAFENVKKNHVRINRGDTTRSEYFVKRESQFLNTMLIGLPTTEAVYQIFAKIGSAVHAAASVIARPLTMEFYG